MKALARRLEVSRLIAALLVISAHVPVCAHGTSGASEPTERPTTGQQLTPSPTPAAEVSQAEDGKARPRFEPPPEGRVAYFIDLFLRKWPDYLFGGVFGAALGFFAKWVLEQMSARIAARREFAKEVTKQISSLAEKHYWALANAAGVLAGQLEGQLASRTAHLIIPWESRSALRARLDAVAEEGGDESFYHLCQMIWLFDSFQFQGSTTYLLTSHSAGDMCKRLYNMFVGSLPDALHIAEIREMTDLVPVEGSDKTSMREEKLRNLPAGTLTKALIKRKLDAESKAYIEWLKHDVVNVSTAANALRAFNELLNNELALLYHVWFRAGSQLPEKYVYEQQLGQWPNLLTRQTADTLVLAGYQSNLLRPLGAAGAAQPGTDSAPSSPQPPPASRREDIQGGDVKKAEVAHPNDPAPLG